MSGNVENNLIKKAHKKQAFTDKQIEEFVKCADPINGPEYFMHNFFYIQHPVRGKIQYVPYHYQEDLIDTYHQNRFSINMLGRQMGKTTTAAGYLLWYAMFVPDSTILIAAHKYLGAQEIMQRIRYAYETTPDHIRCGVTSYNKGSIEFDNGSRIVSQTTTETTGRGMSISLLYCDEFAFVRPTIAREFWASISPTLATGGKAIITSTPNSDDDQFASIWREANKKMDEYGNERAIGRNGFSSYLARWDQHPERDETWAAQERSALGEERFRREHNCEFIIYDETLISPLVLSEMEGTDTIMKQGQIRWFDKPKAGNTYLVSLDPSLGTGGDDAAIQIFQLQGMRQVAEWMHNRTPIIQQVAILREINKYIADEIGDSNNIYYTVENNTLGEAALQQIAEIGEENIAGIFLSEPAKVGTVRRFRKGFNTTNSKKLAACAKLKHWIETKKMRVHSKALISELKTFVSHGAGYEAKLGEKDDLVSAVLLIVRMALILRQYDSDAHAELQDTIDDIIEPMPFIII
jgi:Terminase large subunit, T4likevirus-type, N-terminal/Terminase RNaseH-like domain